MAFRSQFLPQFNVVKDRAIKSNGHSPGAVLHWLMASAGYERLCRLILETSFTVTSMLRRTPTSLIRTKTLKDAASIIKYTAVSLVRIVTSMNAALGADIQKLISGARHIVRLDSAVPLDPGREHKIPISARPRINGFRSRNSRERAETTNLSYDS